MNNHIRKNFTITPNELINDNSIDIKARFLFVWLCSKPEDWKFHNKVIEKSMRFKKDSRIKYTKELIDAGWISVNQKINNDGTFGENDIVLHPQPIKSITDDPSQILTEAEKIGSGKNPPHNKTNNLSNTNNSNKTNEPSTDLFGEQILDPKKKTLFKNCIYSEFDKFILKLKESESLGIDISYYHRAIDRWSRQKQVKRTADGWIATAETWMEKDKDAGKLKMNKTEDQNQQEDQEALEYLNTQ